MKSILSQKKYVLIIIIVLVIVIAAVVALILFKPFQSDAARFSGDYPSTDKNNIFVYKNAKQTADFLENGTGIVFIGFPTCPWCQAYAPQLDSVAKELGFKEIIYLDVYNDRADDSLEYQRLVAFMGNHLLPDGNGNPRIYVPDITVVKNGVIVAHDNETSTISDMEPTDYWTAEKLVGLREKLREMIKLIT